MSVTAAGTSIYAACTTGRETQCRKAKYVEGGKLSGNIILGSFGGTLASGAASMGCVAVLGFATGGPGALACAIIGGGLGGWAGGEVGGIAGERIGEILYEGALL